MDAGFGSWEPLALSEVREAFARAKFRWWVTGGGALELFAGRSLSVAVGRCRSL